MRSKDSRLASLHQEHGPWATRLAYALSGDAERAHTLVRESFVRVLGRFADLRGADALEVALIRTMVRISLEPRDVVVPVLREVAGLSERETAAVLRCPVRSICSSDTPEKRALAARLVVRSRLAPPPSSYDEIAARVRRRRVRRVAGVAGCAVLVGALLTTRADPPTPPRELDRPRAVTVAEHPDDLAYVDARAGVSLLHPDGTHSRWLGPGVLAGPRCGATWCGGFEDLAWSPDGSTLAMVYVGPDGRGLAHGVVYLATSGDSRPHRLAPCPDASCDHAHASGLVWSPDGTHLAVAGYGKIWWLTVATDSAFRRLAGCAGCGARNPAWSPDDRSVAYVSNTGIFEKTIATGVVRRLSDQVPASIAWSPDGTRLLLAGLGIYVLDRDRPGRLVAATSHEDQGGGAYDGAWSPDGTQVVWFATPDIDDHNGYRAELGIAHVATQSSRAVVDHPCCLDTWTAPRWSPDGTQIAWVESTTHRPHPQVWLFVSAPDGGAEHRYPAAEGRGPPSWRTAR